MHTEINNSLPYIKISKPPLKLLIDTGCYNSILNSQKTQEYFANKIYHSPSNLKTGTGEKTVLFKADIPCFPEFNSPGNINYILFDFHEYFDGIIGLKELLKFKAHIDFVNKKLISNNFELPIYFREPQKENYKISINAHEVAKIKIPVDQKNSEVIIPKQNINKLYIPETLSKAENGYATAKVFNHTNKEITLKLKEPIKTVPFKNCLKRKFLLNQFNNIPNKKIKQNPSSDKENYLRTDHKKRKK